ncbi:MCE family protein [Desertifilum sp. FACHB-1129]|uniref:Mce/MlaD domain-containing protein n=1 Tax=Desertifilum tharense IPPAS B-1220 TaxID=1781255 RepID=A0A1E5QI84_9CYAN|nr:MULTISPECIES: MlaD family protein [Desertifilum]MDA0212066.1 MlaD family protein [Cyanobacteria bacterium FC1]MBD2314429.1 MCE family protein [Desertifilum sp. FACHB-1129]MBD2324876.1 MCE family protein [Desertifilum sp. FACHB-866]MBD2334968.1 MCE family protein [Desertifilum sp. FACHB-868]OEJ74304.1 hypothetical protein BH720_15105 [Desertifilum tharense IPPAS B-1220]
MQQRMVREGTVGLFILLGLGLFGFLILWLRGVSFGQRGYSTVVEFADVAGMRVGAVVRYRGVDVGRISRIQPGPNGVDVTIEISSRDLVIPRQVVVEANQSGLVGETSVDIKPLTQLASSTIQAADPTAADCDRALIVCDGSRLEGQIGVSFDELLRATLRVTEVFSDPTFLSNIESATIRVGDAAEGVANLTGDVSALTQSVERELTNFSNAARSVDSAANQIRLSAVEATDQLSVSANQTTAQLTRTTDQATRFLANVDNLISTNRATLVTTLNNLSQTSDQLRLTVSNLGPVLTRVEQSNFIANLDALSNNALTASANLRDLSNALNSPTNIVMLQQTLDSARATFQNAQKITADLDEVTGDPAFRDNLRNLVNGLGGLVSSTEQLEQQVEVAQTLVPLALTYSESVGAEILGLEGLRSPASNPRNPLQSSRMKLNKISYPLGETQLLEDPMAE